MNQADRHVLGPDTAAGYVEAPVIIRVADSINPECRDFLLATDWRGDARMAVEIPPCILMCQTNDIATPDSATVPRLILNSMLCPHHPIIVGICPAESGDLLLFGAPGMGVASGMRV
jgi:hypothetical protein